MLQDLSCPGSDNGNIKKRVLVNAPASLFASEASTQALGLGNHLVGWNAQDVGNMHLVLHGPLQSQSSSAATAVKACC